MSSIKKKSDEFAMLSSSEKLTYIHSQGAEAKALKASGSIITEASCPYTPGAFADAWLAGFR